MRVAPGSFMFAGSRTTPTVDGEHVYTVGPMGDLQTRECPLDSVSYRFYIAAIAVNARDAVAPCTLLHARASFRSRRLPMRLPCHVITILAAPV
jgi:hypothetical protein